MPAVPKGGALVHGRVTDGHNRGIVGLKISLEDEKEQILRFLGRSETDASGYYALILDSRKLKKLAELDGGYLVVSTPAGRIVHREPEVIKVEPSDRLVFAVTLNRADLSPIKPAETPQKDQENEDRSSPAEPTETIDT